MKVASIANAKWPPSNGYTVAAWVYIESSQSLTINSNVGGRLDTMGRKSPAIPRAPSRPPPPPQRRRQQGRRSVPSGSPAQPSLLPSVR